MKEPGTSYKLTVAWCIGTIEGKPKWITNDSFHENLEHAEQRLAHFRCQLRFCILRYKIRKIQTLASGEFNPADKPPRFVPVHVLEVKKVEEGSPA